MRFLAALLFLALAVLALFPSRGDKAKAPGGGPCLEHPSPKEVLKSPWLWP
jgi:hypothetical protein